MNWPRQTRRTYEALVALGGAEREPMSENSMLVRNCLIVTLGIALVSGSVVWATALYNVYADATIRYAHADAAAVSVAAIKAGYVQRVLPGSTVPVWTQADCAR